MNEYAAARVVRLHVPERPVMGSEGLTRQPRIGDVGTIVHVLKADTAYIVECCDGEGQALWIADFDASELEVVEDAP
jgi:hypothetical protein